MALLYPSENRLILGPVDACVGLTAVRKATETRPPAGLSAQISSVHPFVNYFFSFSDNTKLQIIRTKMFKAK